MYASLKRLGRYRPRSINDFFGPGFCINLKDAPARLDCFARSARDAGIAFERFEAIEGVPTGLSDVPLRRGKPLRKGQVGCLLSHRAVIQRAKAEHRPSVLIFEDDVLFDTRANDIFARTIRELPSDWDMLYLSGHHSLKAGRVLRPLAMFRPVISKANRTKEIVGLYRSVRTKTTHAYAVSRSAYARLLDATDPAVVDAPVDLIYARMHAQMKTYVIRPHVAWQANGFSFIEQKKITLLEDYTRYG